MLRSFGRSAIFTLVLPLALEAQGLPESTVQRINQIFHPFDTITSPGCVVGVGRDGRELFAKGYGMANLEYEVPLTAQSISESGSVAKQFTAAALALLQLDGKLSLDDDVRRYLPEVPDFGAPITIRHLLTHTSGLRDQWALLGIMGRGPGGEVHTTNQILDLVSRQRELNFPVGSEYLYSNTGYTLAAVIVSRVSGMPFARFTDERLFRPLGMTHTQWRDDYRRVVPGRATGYDFVRGAWMQDMPFTMIHGNGGLLTTVADLLRWNDALTNGLLGKPDLTALLETRGRLGSGRTLSYALGLVIGSYGPGVREISHGGSTAGYRTFVARYPEAKMSIAVLCNAATANPTSLARGVMALLLPRTTAAQHNSTTAAQHNSTTATRLLPTPIAVDQRALIVGQYRDPRTDDLLTVTAVGDFARLDGPSADSLRAEGDGRFSTSSGYRLTFTPAGQRASHLQVESADGDVREMERMTTPVAGTPVREDLVGTFLSPELDSRIVVRLDKGRLMARLSPDDDATLLPLYTDGFRVSGSGSTIRFSRDAAGRVTGARIFAGRARNVRFDKVP